MPRPPTGKSEPQYAAIVGSEAPAPRADVAELSRQVHLALFYDAQLDIGAMDTCQGQELFEDRR
jgi:hypothetical protein